MRSLACLTVAVALSLPAAAMSDTYSENFSRIVMDMHRDMSAESTGDADIDFAAGMIPHHAGAVAMAELVLEYGSDPELRALAETIIETQTAEIEFLEAWLAENAPQN